MFFKQSLLFLLSLSSLAVAYNIPRPPLATTTSTRRRLFLDTVATAAAATTAGTASIFGIGNGAAWAVEEVAEGQPAAVATTEAVVQVSGDAKKLFNEGRAYESQGNMFAAQRVYNKVTLIEPRFVYGLSNLGNTQTALGDLAAAEVSYTKAIDLCQASIDSSSNGRKCSDMYVLLLNRGSIRLNNGRPEDALKDLSRSDALRGRPDAVVLQNLARAKELNGQYAAADRDYAAAIAMSANEVNPFWLRAALVKYQLGDLKGAMDLFLRVQNRFPEAAEVRAAYAVLLAAKGRDDDNDDNMVAARRKFLEIPDRQRLKYSDVTYLQQTIAWPPAMRQGISKIAAAVGDSAPAATTP